MLFMLASTCQNIVLILSGFLYSHWSNVFFAFPFSEFKRVQTIKLIVSPKIAFGVLFLTILYYFAFFLSRNQLSHETYIDYRRLKRDLGPL